MDTTLLNSIRTSYGFSRSVAYLISVALIALVVERTIYYVLLDNDVIEKENVVEKINRIAPHKARLLGLPETKTQQQRQKEKSNDTKLSEAVVSVQDTLDVLAFNLMNKGDANKAQDKLEQLYSDLQKYDEKAITDFAKTEDHIEKHQLADVIKQRHIDMVENYQNEMKTLLGNLKTIQSTDNIDSKLEAVLAARKQLENKQLKRSQQPFDPENLPFKSVKPDKNNKPKTTLDEFSKAGLYNTPYKQYAALGDFTYDKLAGASNPEYLAESDEIVISGSIKAKAQELNYDPVTIYHWVLNNVEWLPTWGSMQDADITLGSLKGNAFDISSLQIALLRASKIPARYVHGTIDVPEKEFRNWIGGFKNIDAAGNFSSSGGIPTTAILREGQINTIRMEHVWVEAAIDYSPSRGAINKDADNWIQMDPSFKQYTYTDVIDLESITNIDGNAVSNSYLNSGSVNETESWVGGLDNTIIVNAQLDARQKLLDHMNSSMNNPDHNDVIGARRVINKNYPTLPSSFQNDLVLTGKRYSKVPKILQNSVTLSFGKDMFGNPVDTVSLPWVKVNNHKVTVSFKPATIDDENALQSFLEGSDTNNVGSLPKNISAYLINVTPELKINDIVSLQGKPISLGVEVDLGINIGNFSGSQLVFYSKVIAGSTISLTTVGGSVSSKRLSEHQSKLNNLSAILESGDQPRINLMNSKDIIGDIFYAGSLSYFSQNIKLSELASRFQYSQVSFLPSSGTFGYVPNVNYFFGFPNSITPGGVIMDLNNISIAASHLDNDRKKEIDYVRQIGLLGSALEHIVPEQMFNAPNEKRDAISAVKALSIASQQGQRTYYIDKYNASNTLPNINLDSSTMNEITLAVNHGKEVTVHTDPIQVNGWTGAGYLIIDPETGAGAYKISGGFNGGIEKLNEIQDDLFWASTALGVVGSALSNLLGAISTAITVLDALLNCPNPVANFIAALAIAFFVMGIMLAFVFGTIFSPLTGVLVAAAFGYVMNEWLSAVRDYQCQ